MQTLGASNPHNNNKEKHRPGTRITGDTVERVFTPNGGLDNQVNMTESWIYISFLDNTFKLIEPICLIKKVKSGVLKYISIMSVLLKTKNS